MLRNLADSIFKLSPRYMDFNWLSSYGLTIII